MKLDLTPVKATYVAPTFGEDDRHLDPRLEHRLRRPMLVGGAVIGVFVVLLGIWAALAQLPVGVTAPGEIRIESNRKTLRSRDTATVKQVLVREGQQVRAQQPLILFNDVEARAALDVYQNQADVLWAQNARFTAEATNRTTLQFPPELTSRLGDPRVAALVRDQEFLFLQRLQLFQTTTSVLSQQLDQLQSQIGGLQAQVASVDEQRRLTEEELAGYRKLNEQGYAPKTLILRYERTLADLGGRKGQLSAEIARVRQQMGEVRSKAIQLRDQRQSEAAEGMRDSQAKLADVMPRLTTAQQNLAATVLRSPVDGYVFNLTQFTPGGVVGSGEIMTEVVPTGTPLTVSASVKPTDVDQIHIGQAARVRLVGLNARFNPDLAAKVSVISADRITDKQTGAAFYRVDVQIDPAELKKLQRGVELTSGMPAQVMIVSGERSVLGFLISPITETLKDAFREE